jgi:hypothetical protein
MTITKEMWEALLYMREAAIRTIMVAPGISKDREDANLKNAIAAVDLLWSAMRESQEGRKE